MSACDDFINKVNQALPELATTKDLIRVGLFRTDQGAAAARRLGNSPEYFRLNKRVILYPKRGVIEFLKRSKVSDENSDTRNS